VRYNEKITTSFLNIQDKQKNKRPMKNEEITIGDQVWMAENLSVDTFRNGDPIPEAKTSEEWVKAGEAKQPAWCWSTDDPEERKEYGKLYNWFAVNDSRGLAPEGYRIPTDDELEELIVEVQIEEVDGDTRGILNQEIDLPLAGFRGCDNGSLFPVGVFGYYWSSVVSGSQAMGLYFDGGIAYMGYGKHTGGFAVRCLKDYTTD
jgi:uncharacterized protein (TIGR02145 family)